MNISAEAESYSLSDPLTVPKTGTHLAQGCVKERLLRDSCGSEWTLEPYEDMARMLANVIAPIKHCGTSGAQLSLLRLYDTSVEFTKRQIDGTPRLVRRSFTTR